MRRHLRLLLLSLLLVAGVADLPEQAAAQSADRALVAYIADTSNPGYFVLTNRTSVAVSARTQYWVQPLRGGRRRKGSINDVRIEHKVQILVGPNNVAKSVTVLEGQ